VADGHAAKTADALRRTRLATERTYLAWWRTGLTAIAVGVGTGGIAPKLAGERHWAYVAIGIGFASLGVALLAYGLRRQVAVDRALNESGFVPPTPASSRFSRARPPFSAC
jgi:putative membrane protein